MTRFTRHWPRLLAGACAGAVAVVGGVLPFTAHAAESSFTVIARADAFRVAVQATNLAVSDVTDTSGPTGQAIVSSLGQSTGFAALPYPGDTVATTPALATSAAGLPVALPNYPLAVTSQYPAVPDATATQGPVQLHADSSERASSGQAVAAGADSAGNAAGKAQADATSKVDDSGKAISDATSSVESVTISGVLRLGSVTSTAHADKTPDGKPTTSSSFHADGLSVAGTAVGITDKGLTLAGSSVPLPPSSSIAQALKAAGVTDVRYVAPVTGDGSVEAAGLEVTAVESSPSGNTFTVIYSFGFARAEVAGTAEPSATAASSAPITGSSSGPIDTGAPGPTVAGAGDVTSPAPSPLRAATPTQGRARASGNPQTTRLAGVPIDTTSALSFYLVLVIGALVAVGGSVLFRYFAVRLAWTS